MNVSTMTSKIQELVAEGKTLEEALQVVLTESSKTQPRRDNVAYIESLTNLPEVRRVKKIAYAKISKSKGKDEAIARYKQEIEAADLKLTELLKEVNSAECPWKKAMELGEDAASAFNYYFSTYKDQIDKEVEKKAKGKTKAEVKAALIKISPVLPGDMPEIFHEVAVERVQNGDMMVVTVLKKVGYLQSIKK